MAWYFGSLGGLLVEQDLFQVLGTTVQVGGNTIDAWFEVSTDDNVTTFVTVGCCNVGYIWKRLWWSRHKYNTFLIPFHITSTVLVHTSCRPVSHSIVPI
jgi:hypothetical protein